MKMPMYGLVKVVNPSLNSWPLKPNELIVAPDPYRVILRDILHGCAPDIHQR